MRFNVSSGRQQQKSTRFSSSFSRSLNCNFSGSFDGSLDSWNYGLGAEYKLDGKNGVRADWTKSEYTNSDLSSNTLSVGYVRHF